MFYGLGFILGYNVIPCKCNGKGLCALSVILVDLKPEYFFSVLEKQLLLNLADGNDQV